mgnify:CR=1 FL=1
METIVYEVELIDGRTFRIFCGNNAQKKRFIQSYHKLTHLFKKCNVLTYGIHNIKEWENIVKTIN